MIKTLLKIWKGCRSVGPCNVCRLFHRNSNQLLHTPCAQFFSLQQLKTPVRVDAVVPERNRLDDTLGNGTVCGPPA